MESEGQYYYPNGEYCTHHLLCLFVLGDPDLPKWSTYDHDLSSVSLIIDLLP
jgi:hypothetical protein